MKRFRTKKKYKYQWIFLFGLFLLLFSLLSLLNLQSNLSDKLFVFWDKKEFDKITSFNNYLGKLINLYSFNEKKVLALNTNIQITINGDEEIVSYVRNNLKRLGITSQITNNPLITIILNNDDETSFYEHKEYAKIKLTLPVKLKEKITRYTELIDIYEGKGIIFQINSSKDNEIIKNSTEIVSLIIYDILGD